MTANHKNNEEKFSAKDRLLQEIQEDCSPNAEEILSLATKRVKRTINTWPVFVFHHVDDYPTTFTSFDILVAEYHLSKSWEDIGLLLENAIDKAIHDSYDSLTPQELFFLKYSECYIRTKVIEREEIEAMICRRFLDMLKEHWIQSRKIQAFEEKKHGKAN